MSNLSITSPGLTYSDETYQLQWNLSALGFNVAQDGQFGSETRQAVMDFQSTWGLTVDGIAGPMTQAAIQEALDLMNQELWDPYNDPMKAIPTTVSGAPKTISSPAAISTLLAQSASSILPPTKTGIDWKWIMFGIAGAMAVFGLMGGGEVKRRRRRTVKVKAKGKK